MQLKEQLAISVIGMLIGGIIATIITHEVMSNKKQDLEIQNRNKFIIQKQKNKIKIDSLENVLLDIQVEKMYKQIIKEEELCN